MTAETLRADFIAFLRLTRAGLMAFTRDRAGLVWSFLLPVFLVLLFGTLFGDAGKPVEPTKFLVGLVMEADGTGPTGPETAWVPDAFRQVPLFTVTVGGLDDETAALRAGERRAVVVFPADFGARLFRGEATPVRILYDPTQPPQTTQMVRGALRQALAVMDRKMTGAPALLEPREEPIPTALAGGRAEPRSLDYILPGLFGMTAMQLGIFTAIPLINLREKGVLKRLRATPVSPGVVVAAQVAQRLVVAVVQSSLLIVLGRVVFDFRIACSPFVLLPVLLFGVLLFIALGAVLASAAKTQEAGMSLVQITNLPLMLFSGLMIPAELLPASVRPLMAVLPTTYLGDALRQLMLDAPGARPFTTDMAVLTVWLLGSILLAGKVFRWE